MVETFSEKVTTLDVSFADDLNIKPLYYDNLEAKINLQTS